MAAKAASLAASRVHAAGHRVRNALRTSTSAMYCAMLLRMLGGISCGMAVRDSATTLMAVFESSTEVVI